MRCRDDLRRAHTSARRRVSKQLLRHDRIYRDGKSQCTKMHRAWVARQRLDDDLAHQALEQMLVHLDGLDRQLEQIDQDLEKIARDERWAARVEILTRFKGVPTRAALGLIAEIGDFHRFSHPRELCAWLGIVPSEYSSGQQRHRGHFTKTGNHHARRLLIEAAWSYQHRPRRPDRDPEPDARAWQAQIRLHRRYRHLTTERGKRSTVATVAVARELAGFLWAAATGQPFVHETTTADPPALEAAAA
jgi:transposase